VATAPVRVADVGGWTDTWFARSGAVCNVAVGPGARVEVRRRPGPATVVAPQVTSTALLDGAVAAWGGDGVELHVVAAVPPACSVGTSAAVLVALVAALAAVDGEDLTPDEAARRAWQVEIDAGRESGVQDHVAAAWGGVSWIEVGPFPAWRRTAVAVPEGADAVLLTVHLGGAHDSSDLHRSVIARAEAGDDAIHATLAELAGLAAGARDAIEAGAPRVWGATLTAATEAQARLLPALVAPAARAVCYGALAAGALGWKVNGAGGAGGSVTILAGPGEEAVVRTGRALTAAGHLAGLLPLEPSTGLAVT
jgi:D-glycero-alpha-D-manno-heptose-7-phosphate kinase